MRSPIATSPMSYLTKRIKMKSLSSLEMHIYILERRTSMLLYSREELIGRTQSSFYLILQMRKNPRSVSRKEIIKKDIQHLLMKRISYYLKVKDGID